MTFPWVGSGPDHPRRVLHVYGDSHATSNFSLAPAAVVHAVSAVTMHRVGRDRAVPGLNRDDIDGADVLACYGEVDCRCHVGRQVAAGRSVDDVLDALVSAYVAALAHATAGVAARVIVCRVTPTRRAAEVTRATYVPFVGTDAERVDYTRKMNARLRDACALAGFVFLAYDAAYYSHPDGTLRDDKSDEKVHLTDPSRVLAALAAVR